MKNSRFCLSLFALLTSASAFAAPKTAFRCFGFFDTQETTVEVNLKSKKASYFDSERWIETEQSSGPLIVGEGMAYSFRGALSTHETMTIEFRTGAPMKAIITKKNLMTEFKRESTSLDCSAIKPKDLISGI